MLLLLPINNKIKGLVGSQNGANIYRSAPIRLQDPAIYLYTSVVDFIHVRRLVESALYTVTYMWSYSGTAGEEKP